MDAWPVSLSTSCFYQLNILSCLKTIKDAGFDWIEVCSTLSHLDYHDSAAVRHVHLRIHEVDMKTSSFHAPFAEHIDISSPSDPVRKKALAEIFLAAEAAALLEATYFVIHPGPERESIEERQVHIDRLKYTTESLFRIGAYCRRLGVRCVLENKLPHLVFAKIEDLVFILDATAISNIGVCLDTGHAHVARTLETMLDVLAPFLCMVHAHDNRAHSDEHLPPGEGGIDWTRFASGLKAARFNGLVVLELSSSGNNWETMERAKRGRAFLLDTFRQAGLLPASN
jgi:sugar phosphate isomerase/epimerase